MKKKFLTVFLLAALTVSLGGCAFTGHGGKEETLCQRASGLAPDETVVQVDGRAVTAERYLYLLIGSCDYLRDYYAAAGRELDWSTPLGSGQTLAGYAKQRALDTAALYAEIELLAERYGCQLTEADQASLKADESAAVEQYGGDAAYQARLTDLGLSRSGARALSEDYCLYSHLCELYATEGSALHPTEGTADAAGFDALLQAAADAAEITYTRAYDTLNVADFYGKLTAGRQTPDPSGSASASAPAASAPASASASAASAPASASTSAPAPSASAPAASAPASAG